MQNQEQRKTPNTLADKITDTTTEIQTPKQEPSPTNSLEKNTTDLRLLP